MAWEQRGDSGQYLYRSYRTADGRIRKKYFGKGAQAQREVQQIAASKAQQLAEEQAIQEECQRIATAVQMTKELEEISQLLMEATLFSKGFWRGKDYRAWRKRRGSSTKK